MGKYFGTDGIRGVAGEDLNAELSFKAGRAIATALSQMSGVARPRVMIARDTRISCDMLEAALSAGMCSAGADVSLLGVLPTPAAAYLTVKEKSDMGVVISASHNPFDHNGIKVFGRNGFKLSDSLEERIEQLIDDDSGVIKTTGGDIGRINGEHGYWANEYVRFLRAASEGRYSGYIAIDCGNGAASETARLLFRQLGVKFELLFNEPDGTNINNNCGSTHIEALQDFMRTGRFDVGFAFDGDADRCLTVDENGSVIDGDMMLAALARDMKASGKLKGNGMVGTVVSNSGMEHFARDNGFVFHRAAVGDKNVLDMMKDTGCNIGGESSGHLIFSDDATTGDGQLTAIKYLNIMTKTGKKASELARDIPRFPQVMPGVRLTGGAEEKDAIMADARLAEEITKQERLLGDEGRVLVRPSGTEPVIRVLVEAKTETLAGEIAANIISCIESLQKSENIT